MENNKTNKDKENYKAYLEFKKTSMQNVMIGYLTIFGLLTTLFWSVVLLVWNIFLSVVDETEWRLIVGNVVVFIAYLGMIRVAKKVLSFLKEDKK